MVDGLRSTPMTLCPLDAIHAAIHAPSLPKPTTETVLIHPPTKPSCSRPLQLLDSKSLKILIDWYPINVLTSVVFFSRNHRQATPPLSLLPVFLLSPLECAVPSPLGSAENKRVTAFLAQPQTLWNLHLRGPLRNAENTGLITSLESALTENSPVTPLECALTKNMGVGGYRSLRGRWPNIGRVHLHGYGPLDQLERNNYAETALFPLQDAFQPRERSPGYPDAPPHV